MKRLDYLLVCLMEECAEVQKLAAKILRFGPETYHPLDDLQTSNRDLLTDELIDTIAVLELLCGEGLLNEHDFADEMRKRAKQLKIKDYMEQFGHGDV